MHPIPASIRKKLANDLFMTRCAIKGCGRPAEWHHALQFQGRQVQEVFAIVPACPEHHTGKGKNDRLWAYLALYRFRIAPVDIRAKYIKSDWELRYDFLQGLYGPIANHFTL